MYSKTLFGPWLTPQDEIIPCSTVPKGAVFHGKIVFAGFERIGNYAGNMTFKTAVNGKDGVLIFE